MKCVASSVEVLGMIDDFEEVIRETRAEMADPWIVTLPFCRYDLDRYLSTWHALVAHAMLD